MSSIIHVVFDRSREHELVAQYAGERRFAASDTWAQRYADAVATVLERPVVRVDIADRVVG